MLKPNTNKTIGCIIFINYGEQTSMVNILIVGFGSIGRTHLENLLQFKNVKIIVCTKRTDLNSFIEQGVKVQ